MICDQCKRGKIVMHAFSEGDCNICKIKLSTAHTPCDKLCEECSEKYNLCKECGSILENNLPKLVCDKGQRLKIKKEIKFQDDLVLNIDDTGVVKDIVGYGFDIVMDKNNLEIRCMNSEILNYFELI